MFESPGKVPVAVIGPNEIGVRLRSLAALAGGAEQADLRARPTKLWEVFQKHRPDVVLLSIPVYLPEPIVTARNSHEDLAKVAFILLADVADERIVAKCLAMGATADMAEGGRLVSDSQTSHACRAVRTNR